MEFSIFLPIVNRKVLAITPPKTIHLVCSAKFFNKSQNIDGSNDISYSSHDINFTNIAIGTATSWNYTTPGVYGVASSAAFTGEGHPESTNGGLTPYRYG